MVDTTSQAWIPARTTVVSGSWPCEGCTWPSKEALYKYRNGVQIPCSSPVKMDFAVHFLTWSLYVLESAGLSCIVNGLEYIQKCQVGMALWKSIEAKSLYKFDCILPVLSPKTVGTQGQRLWGLKAKGVGSLSYFTPPYETMKHIETRSISI